MCDDGQNAHKGRRVTHMNEIWIDRHEDGRTTITIIWDGGTIPDEQSLERALAALHADVRGQHPPEG